MKVFFPIKTFPKYETWAFYKKAFTTEECLEIRKLFINPTEGMIGDNGAKVKNSDVRRSEVSWIGTSKKTEWIYKKLGEFAYKCNEARYGFDLTGFSEDLQLGRYGKEGHYGWHQDLGRGELAIRKLSLVLQLSDPREYTGGELEFKGYKEPASNDQGDLIVFPSFNTHRVTPLSSGERFSLVSWVSGPSFR